VPPLTPESAKRESTKACSPKLPRLSVGIAPTEDALTYRDEHECDEPVGIPCPDFVLEGIVNQVGQLALSLRVRHGTSHGYSNWPEHLPDQQPRHPKGGFR